MICARYQAPANSRNAVKGEELRVKGEAEKLVFTLNL